MQPRSLSSLEADAKELVAIRLQTANTDRVPLRREIKHFQKSVRATRQLAGTFSCILLVLSRTSAVVVLLCQ